MVPDDLSGMSAVGMGGMGGAASAALRNSEEARELLLRKQSASEEMARKDEEINRRCEQVLELLRRRWGEAAAQIERIPGLESEVARARGSVKERPAFRAGGSVAAGARR